MSSLNQGGPSSKSTKFVAANPLDPMLRPFAEQDGLVCTCWWLLVVSCWMCHSLLLLLFARGLCVVGRPDRKKLRCCTAIVGVVAYSHLLLRHAADPTCSCCS
jgi:hypothetical protein